jgi:hypothetical protein
LLNAAGASAATTSAAGIVELATAAEALTGTDATRAVTPAGLYFPTGHLYGLTLSNNGTDATNDIDISAGTARDASDTYNYVLPSTYVKQIDAAWALGSAAGGLDTGSVGDSRYAIWGIGRSDTKVCDVLFSTSFSSPTMPSDYDFKVLLGEFTRAGGVNGTPLWYGPRRAATGYAGITLGSPTASTSGTSIDFTGIPAWAKRITVMFSGVSLSGSADLLIQIGDAGGVETSSYTSTFGAYVNGGANVVFASTAGYISYASQAAATASGMMILQLLDTSKNLWVGSSTSVSAGAGNVAATSGGTKALSAVLDRVRITTTNGSDTFDAGTINISYE